MEMTKSDIRDKQICFLSIIFEVKTAEINFEKLLGWTAFKNANFSLFQSSSVLHIRGICFICRVILTFL